MRVVIVTSFCLLCVIASGCSVFPAIKADSLTEGVSSDLANRAEMVEQGQQKSVGITELADSISAYLPEYTYLANSVQSPTAFSVWITYERNSSYHVPWFVGGDWFVENSDQIILDPVNKTISLGFDAESDVDICTQLQLDDERDVVGYTPCSSGFYSFKKIVNSPIQQREASSTNKPAQSFWRRLFSGSKEQTPELESEFVASEPKEIGAETLKYQATIDLDLLALTVVQLNLLTKAEHTVAGEGETSEQQRQRLRKKIIASQRYFEQNLERVQKKSIQHYIKGADVSRLNIKKQTIDKSGYFNYDIVWPTDLTLTANTVSIEEVNYGQFVSDFEHYGLTDALEPLASITLSKMKSRYLRDRKRIMRSLNHRMSDYQVECPAPEYIGDYQVVVKCPNKVMVSKKDMPVTLTYEVLAKRFDLMIPRYTSYNNDLTIVADAETLSLKNNSNSNININRIEWLANDAAQKITRKTDKNAVLAIAKGQTVSIPLVEKVSAELKQELNIPHLSKRQALRKHIDYGFDVSYQVVGNKDSLTASPKVSDQTRHDSNGRLNQKSRYNLNELLLSR